MDMSAVCVCIYTCVLAHVWESQKKTLDVFFDCSPPFEAESLS